MCNLAKLVNFAAKGKFRTTYYKDLQFLLKFKNKKTDFNGF